MAVLQHVGEFEIAEAADGRVAHIGRQRSARIGVFEKKCDRVADEHLVPDAQAHRRALFRVDGLAAQILLVDAHIEDIEPAKPADDGCFQPYLEKKNVQTRLVDDRDDLAKQYVYAAGSLFHDRVHAKKAQQPKEQRHQHVAGDEGGDNSNQEIHCLVSNTASCALLKSPSRTLRT